MPAIPTIRSRLLRIVCFAVFALAGGPGSAAEIRRIGVSLADLGNPFFVRMARGVEAASRKLIGPDVKVTVASSAYDLSRQVAQIDGFIRDKVDLIILNAADPYKIEPAVRKAQAAGIPVIAIDVRAAGADATVGMDNLQAGAMACSHIAERLGSRGKVIIINGPRVSAVIDRVQGCRQALAAHPQIQLLSADKDGGGSAEGGFVKMTDLLTRHPHVDAVFAINDPTAIGAEQAARQAGRSEFFIVGVDAAPGSVARLRDAGSLIAASVAQLPGLQAEKAVGIGVALVQHRPVANRTILVPPILVTKDTVRSYKGWGD